MNFQNAPDAVARRIRLLPIASLLPQMRYVAAAGLLTEHYLGFNMILKNRDDPFLRFERRTPEGLLWQFPARVVQIAQVIFDLRNDPGFSEFCRRLSGKRDLQSAFFEVVGAAMFKAHGFTIEAKPETHVRTKDFDFTASIAGVTTNVEVFALRRPEFGDDALLKRLKDKRKQLPSNAPAVLVCFYPNDWREQVSGLHLRLVGVAMRFFASSERINCILFAREEWEESPPLGGAISLSCFTVSNDRPRHPSDSLARALESEPPTHAEVETLMASPASLLNARGSGAFYGWVDWVISSDRFRLHPPILTSKW